MRSLLCAALLWVPVARAAADWLPPAADDLLAQAKRMAAGPRHPGLAGRDALAVMTFNVRYASWEDEPDAWPDRRPVVKALLRSYAPDLIGTQEGVWGQVPEIAADLPGYAWIGEGADDGAGAGEYMAVYYKRARLEALGSGHFWLSDTPDVVGSTTWGNRDIRMVTWVRFRDRRTGREFQLWNTHLDHQVQRAREKSAALILSRMARLPADMPVILTGDFNAVAGENPVYEKLAGPGALSDTWTAAPVRLNEGANTLSGFGPPPREGKRIDWILTRGPFVVHGSELVAYHRGKQWPSDHLPVLAWLELR